MEEVTYINIKMDGNIKRREFAKPRGKMQAERSQ